VFLICLCVLETQPINPIHGISTGVQPGPGGTTLNYGASTGLSGVLFQAFIILHELGHLTDAYGATNDDSSNTATGKANQIANNTVVLKDCFNKNFNPNP